MSKMRERFASQFTIKIGYPLPFCFYFLCCVAVVFTGGCVPTLKAPRDAQVQERYKPTRPSSWTLPNGLTVFFRQDSELPIVQSALLLKGGALWEDAEDVGSTAAMGDQMRQGGAGPLTPDELDRALEAYAASISSAFGAENGKVSMSCLSTDLDQIFPLFAGVVLQPRFDSDRLNLFKGQSLEALRRRIEDGETVADLSFAQLVFANSALGRVPVASQIQKLNRELLQKYHKHFVRPDGAVLAITGDITESRARVLVEEYFSKWLPRGTPLPEPERPQTLSQPGIYFVELPFSQSTIQMGQLGVPRLSPDYVAIDVFNEIFGTGGFGSRLMSRVRTELGLAYGVYGFVAPGFPIGRNIISLQTKSESTGQALVESLSELRRMQTEAVTYAELSESKRTISNAFVFKFDSTEKLVQRHALFELLGYPSSYDQTYIEKLELLTAADIQEVARRRWDINSFVIVVVGNNSAYTQLEQLTKSGTGPLAGKPLRKLRFDQKLIIE
jgi:zinc protease